jgi:hypothetical protein
VSPVGSHASNGGAERAVQMVRGLARVYLDSLRAKAGAKTLDARSPWWTWATRHAAWTYNRFHVRPDLRCTPYTKVKWRVYAQPIVPFGELVLARRPGAHLQKAESWFVYGAWAGRDGRTDEHLIVTRAGVLRSRAVRRLTPDQCWSTELIDEVPWTPWRTAAVMRGRPPRQQEEQEPITSASMPTGEAAFALPSRTGPAPPMGAPSATAVPSAAHAPEPPPAEAAASSSSSSSSAAPAQQMTAQSAAAVPIPVDLEKRPAALDEGPLSRKKPRTTEITIQEINEVSTVCEKAEPERAADLMASSSEGASRLTTARRAHLKKLTHHEVYEAHQVPPGVRPMTVRWVRRCGPCSWWPSPKGTA